MRAAGVLLLSLTTAEARAEGLALQELQCSDSQASPSMQGATARLLCLACLCLSLTAGEAGYARYSQHKRRTLRRTFRLQSSLPGTQPFPAVLRAA